MKRVELISASAGTGKTHRLATIVEEAVCSGNARPHAVVAVTFTKRAADQLSHRLRDRLLGAGRIHEAREMIFARIGTVHAVCSRLVTEFAFELGVSPEVEVIEEERARLLFAEVLSSVVDDVDAKLLEDARQRMVELDWTDAVHQIVTLLRTNGLPATEAARCENRSQDSLAALMPADHPAMDLEAALAQTLERFLAAATARADDTTTTARAVELAGDARRRMVSGRPLPWSIWNRLAALEAGAALADDAAEVRRAACQLAHHPRLKRDLESVTRRCFDIAGRALHAFQMEKQRRGVIDFVDQEQLALELLRLPEVRERLTGEIDLLLVDEFQDTSPLQLAVFAALSELASRSVWVGDQKQAIYGFRGADPRLMDAALAAVFEGGEPEILHHSWRSRPELVRLTSELFAPPFESSGIPRSRVELLPANEVDAPGLGQVVERWRLNAPNKPSEAHALAGSMVKFLSADVRVRDGSGGTKRAGPGDVAVLCRTNESCRRVAAAMTAQGIACTVARPGLMSTPEALLMHAGLRLWAVPRDVLAAAEIARIVGREEEWANEAFASDHVPFADLPEVLAIRRARETHPWAGVVTAFDSIVSALDVPRLCCAWGDAERRLQGLDTLRALAAAYADEHAGNGATVAGLIEHLSLLAAQSADEMGTGALADSVRVLTWHAAKGLEWPVVVLYDLDASREGTALGVQAVGPESGFSLDDPLAGRWVRFWPNPFLSVQETGPFFEALAGARETREAVVEQRRQELRLLYVGWTRARDRLVLAARSDRLTNGILSLLEHRGLPLVREPMARATWGRRKVDVVIREGAPRSRVVAPTRPGARYPAFASWTGMGAARAFEPRDEGAVREVFELGPGISVVGEWSNAEDLGNALHTFFAADTPELDGELRARVCEDLVRAHGVVGNVVVTDVIAASDSLRRWVGARWPRGRWRNEWPIWVRGAEGAAQGGISDLVIDDELGLIVIDHKSFAQAREQAVAKAVECYAQVRSYADALTRATSRPVLGMFIHLPVAGLVVELEPSRAPGSS